MKQDKKVSIIIPVYNVEKYIKRCVKSLMDQDYPNIEIVLVDDGSQDSSSIIMDELAVLDARIIVIHKENGGVSSARNAGLDAANGDYIMFVDGDDWVDTNYVRCFLNAAEASGCPCVYNKSNYGDGLSDKNKDGYFSVDAEKAIEWIYTGEVFVAVWNKIYSADILKAYKLCFNESIWYAEGMLFNIQCLQVVDRIAVIERDVYHQTYNPDSAMRSFNLQSNYCGLSSMYLQRAIWKKKNKAIEQAWKYHCYRYNRSIMTGIGMSNKMNEHIDIFRECVRNLRKDLSIPLKNERKIRTKAGWVLCAMFPKYMARRALAQHIKASESESNHSISSEE